MHKDSCADKRLSVYLSPEYSEVRRGDREIDAQAAEAQQAIRALMALSDEVQPDARREQLAYLVSLGERLKQCVRQAEELAMETSNDPSVIRTASNETLDAAVTEEIAHGPYRRAYRTEQGSIYLETPAGCTLRIKGPDTRGTRVQPACARTYFVTNETAEEFLQARKEGANGEELIGRSFGHVPFGIGVRPLEFDPACTFDRTLLRVETDRFVIEGMANGGMASNTIAGVNHVGHAVTDVLRETPDKA